MINPHARMCPIWVNMIVLFLSPIGACVAQNVGHGQLIGRWAQLTVGPPVTLSGVERAPRDLTDEYPVVFDALRAAIGNANRRTSSGGVPIDISVVGPQEDRDWRPEVRDALKHRQAYWISIRADAVHVVAHDAGGALYAINHLIQVLEVNGREIPQGDSVDWPDNSVRLLHFGTSPRMPLRTLYARISWARASRYTGVVLSLNLDGLEFSELGRGNRDDLWLQSLVPVVEYAKQSGLDVIPEIRLLSHQERFFGTSFPRLMYNDKTYDPRNPRTYQIVYTVLDRIIQVFHPKEMLIGHDEVSGILPRGQKRLPASLFLEDVIKLHAYLSGRSIQTWMWGDMLISKEEFPGMLGREMHAVEGYQAVRAKLPKDIVICDWHYFDVQADFPSARAFASEGFRVVGTTWYDKRTIRNFSRYLSGIGPNGIGMMATMWNLKGSVRQEDLIRYSGAMFWNPDVPSAFKK